MKSRAPSASFSSVELDWWRVEARRESHRIHRTKYGPLDPGMHPTRFSDPLSSGDSARYLVLYLGSSLEVGFLETVLRDARNGVVGDVPVDLGEISSRTHAVIRSKAELRLVDLRGPGLVRMGIPTDVAFSSNQALAREWSAAINAHPVGPDGIAWSSRLRSQDTNVAIYDRALTKLEVISGMPLVEAPELPALLRKYRVLLIQGN